MAIARAQLFVALAGRTCKLLAVSSKMRNIESAPDRVIQALLAAMS